MSLLDHDVITERYFFPRSTPPDPEHRVDVEVVGATLACARWDFGNDRTLVHFHGNGEVVADWQDSFPEIAEEAGVNLFLAEYRGYGESSGTPRMGAMLDDVEAIADAAGDDLVAFGRSVGSIYAIELAHRRSVAGLVLESGIADVMQRILMRASPEELGASREALQEAFEKRLDHEKKLVEIDAPLLVLHAENDHLVDVDHAHRNAKWASGPTTKKIFGRGDHNSIFAYNRDEYVEALTSFLRELD